MSLIHKPKEFRKFIAPIIVDCLYEESIMPRKAVISLPRVSGKKWRENPFLRKTLRPLYHWFQDRTSSILRPRSITTFPEFKKDLQPILDFLESENSGLI